MNYLLTHIVQVILAKMKIASITLMTYLLQDADVMNVVLAISIVFQMAYVVIKQIQLKLLLSHSSLPDDWQPVP